MLEFSIEISTRVNLIKIYIFLSFSQSLSHTQTHPSTLAVTPLNLQEAVTFRVKVRLEDNKGPSEISKKIDLLSHKKAPYKFT